MSEQDQAALKVTLKIKAFFIGVLLFFKELLDYLVKIVALTIAVIAVILVMGGVYQLNTGGKLDASISVTKHTYIVP